VLFQKKIESKIKNKWLAENLKYLPAIVLLYILLAILPIFLNAAFAPDFNESLSKTISDPYFLGNLIYIACNMFCIMICVTNTIFILQKINSLDHYPGILLIVKIVAVFIGVTIGTILSYKINNYLIEAGLRPLVTKSNFTFNGKNLSVLAAKLFTNNFAGLLICVPIFISEFRKQDIILKLKEKELELNKAEITKTQTQLELLQSKINPHFLYNALNSIASLAHEEPDKVEKMAISLSKLFRYSITTSSNNYASIKEETDIIRHYLDIEKIRFGDKLNYSIIIDADPAILIPRFLIQPLVENAVKHGTSKITTSGLVEVKITSENKEVIITVHDNGPSFPEGLISGYGLQSTQEKLNLLFPNSHELSFTNGTYKQIIIKLKITNNAASL